MEESRGKGKPSVLPAINGAKKNYHQPPLIAELTVCSISLLYCISAYTLPYINFNQAGPNILK